MNTEQNQPFLSKDASKLYPSATAFQGKKGKKEHDIGSLYYINISVHLLSDGLFVCTVKFEPERSFVVCFFSSADLP